jgi:hypothetical protein
MRTDPASISRYDMCKLACETYTLALSAVNLQSAFRNPFWRSGIILFPGKTKYGGIFPPLALPHPRTVIVLDLPVDATVYLLF